MRVFSSSPSLIPRPWALVRSWASTARAERPLLLPPAGVVIRMDGQRHHLAGASDPVGSGSRENRPREFILNAVSMTGKGPKSRL